MLFTPPPVTNCHTFSDPLLLERDVLYGRPIDQFNIVLDRDKAFCLYRKSPLIRHFPLANSPSFIYPAVLIDISGIAYLSTGSLVNLLDKFILHQSGCTYNITS